MNKNAVADFVSLKWAAACAYRRHATTLVMALVVACTLSGIACAECMAQNVIARPFPFFYQLFSNEITAIQQDSEGYMWVGTTDGVARYDGHRLTTFRNDYSDASLLPSNRVNCLADGKRYLWIGTGRGVALYDKTTCSITPAVKDLSPKASEGSKLLATQSISNIATSDDNVWVATGGTVIRCANDGSKAKTYNLAQRRDVGICQIYIDRQQRVWALCYGGLFLFDKEKDTFRKYPTLGKADNAFTMCQDHEGNYWIGTWGEGLWRFQPKGKTAEECYQRQVVKVSATGSDDPDAFCIVQDDVMGYLWILSYRELHTFKCEKGHLTPVSIDSGIDPHMMFTMITKDREGSLWLGSYDMGYNIFFNRSGIDNFAMPQLKQRLGWDANLVNLIADGDLVWASQDRYGLMLYNTVTNDLADLHQHYGEISKIKKSAKGGVWLLQRYKNQIVKAERQGMTVSYPTEIQLTNTIANPGNITDFAEDASANLWIITTNNLFVWQRSPKPIVSIGSGLPCFSTLVADGQDTVWAFADNRLYALRLSRSSLTTLSVAAIKSLAGDEKVLRCCLDSKGRLWAATSQGRILQSDGSKVIFTDTHLGAFVSDAPILRIAANKGKLWIATSKRIMLCNEDGQLIRMWHANEGSVLVKAFRQNAVDTDGKGGFMAGGHGGFIHINDYKAQQDNGSKIVVTDVTVNDQSIIFSRSDSLNTTMSVQLTPGDRNVRIFFSSLRYSLQPQTIISYKLEGIDKNWQTATDNTFSAFYNELPAGEYRFLIRSQMPDGQWGKARRALVITQKPVFYKTTLAYIIYIVIAVGIFCLCYRNRQRLQAIVLRLQTMHKMYAGKMKLSVVGENASDKSMLIDNNADKDFMTKVITEIRLHIAESNFGIDRLAEILSMSRSTLYRRVTAATGVTPADIIRRVQFERACEMLEEQSQNISEIAYAVGFTNPKYFAKCFKDEFGISPSEYQKQHKSVQNNADNA